ncbi:DUF6473 family protein [Pseudooceanicola sp.]|uniref:DUF6473 family protein n=1 Tax=Pseudooceanicola sp. TaxID=1914328 RepID=UPI004057D930
MSHVGSGAAALEYFPCRYGACRTVFRGPRRPLDGDYIAFLGGTETYGLFVPRPFPALVEDRLGLPCPNFGWKNAGPDAFLNDPDILAAARAARAVVLQVPGAHNLTNRYYSVHAARNDRFLRAAPAIRRLFPEVDFTDFTFTRHMLHTLAERHPDRFSVLVVELRHAWSARMGELIAKIGRPVALVRFGSVASEAAGPAGAGDPLFVTDGMLASLSPAPAVVIDAMPGPTTRQAGTAGMVFSAEEAQAARNLPGPAAHAEAAERIAAHLSDLLALGTG